MQFLLHVWLTSLNITTSHLIHVVHMTGCHPFWWLNSIQFVHLSCFLCHASVDVHLGCSHLSALENSAAMNLGCRCLFDILTLFPLAISPVDALVDLVILLLVVLWGASMLISTVAVLMHIPPTACKGSPLWTPHQHLLSWVCLVTAVLAGERGQAIVVLICISLMICKDELVIFYAFIWEMSLRSTGHFLNHVACFLLFEVLKLYIHLFNRGVTCDQRTLNACVWKCYKTPYYAQFDISL